MGGGFQSFWWEWWFDWACSACPPRLQGQRIHSSHSPFARVSQQCRAPPVRFWAQRLGPQSGRPTPSVETPPSPWEASLLWKEPMR